MRIEKSKLDIRTYNSPKVGLERLVLSGLPLKEALSRASVELEIGCGVGWHPIQRAKAISDLNSAIIAVERTSNKFNAFQRRLDNHRELLNLITAIHADAFQFVAHQVPNQSLDRLWLMYPNPEIKKSNNRWYRSPGFRRALQAVKPSGTFHFATNLLDFAEAAETHAPHLGLRLLEKKVLNLRQTPLFSPRTHFEKKYFERGDALYDFVFDIN